MKISELNLGDHAQDILTGFKGIVVSTSEHINGCWRIGIQAKIDKDGKVPSLEWFDIETIRVLDKKTLKIKKSGTGGPKPNPKRRKDG